MIPPEDELEEALVNLERLDSERPSTEITIVTSGKEKNSLIPKIPNTRLAQIVAGLVAIAVVVKIVWEILKL